MGSRILLADDSITIQKVVNLTFADEGIDVVAVSNGDLAERRLNDVKPDLVLADIFMPGKNGYELCETIKKNPLFRNVPVVLLVGAFEPFDQAEARRVQADAHLTKPFESRTLVETVRRLISESGRATTGPIAALPSSSEGHEDTHQPNPMQTRGTAPALPKLDVSEMMVGQAAPDATPSNRKTGELASLLAGAAPEVFDFGVEDMPAHEAVEANLIDASEQFDPLEMSSLGEFPDAEMETSSAQDQTDMILDFDKVDPLESAAPVGTVSFETKAGSQPDDGGSGEGAARLDKADLDSRTIEAPSTNNAWQARTTTAPLNGQASTLRMHNEAAFAPVEGSNETACATMLAGDDPLGDVLLDEPISSGMSSFGHDLLEIALTEPAVTPDTEFELVDTAEDSSDSSEAFAEIEGSRENELELNGSEGGLELIDQPDADVAGLSGDSQADFVESDDILDWTSPNAGSFSTVPPDSVMMQIDTPEFQLDSGAMTIDTQESPLDSVVIPMDPLESPLDSVMMPVDRSESLTENPVHPSAQEIDNAHEASFESARTWPEQEARFAAIDIEAFPVDDSEAPARLETAETGFSLSSVTAEPPSPSIEVRATDATPSEQTTNGAQSPTELSSAAIEEIVRRVVAQMSESVVREVAWEVVPDCVERVIDQLTRESLSRRA